MVPHEWLLAGTELSLFKIAANGFSGTLPPDAFQQALHLEVILLGKNHFKGCLPSNTLGGQLLQIASLVRYPKMFPKVKT
eukprot:1346992-Amphidinium_carterae.1